MPKDAESAKAALDRITIPQDVLGRIAGTVPRSSLIVTDEPLSSETGNGTEFVVLLSGEPQGGIKKRRRRLWASAHVLALAVRKSVRLVSLPPSHSTSPDKRPAAQGG